MITTVRCRPVNGLLLVVSAEEPQVPHIAVSTSEPVTATSTCVAIGTRRAADVEVTLTDEYVEPAGLHRLYAGTLEAAELHAAVQGVDGEQFAEMTLMARQAAISVYGNDPTGSDRVVVQIA